MIDIKGASMADGARLDAWPMKTTDNDNQLWELVLFFGNESVRRAEAEKTRVMIERVRIP